MPGNAFAFCQPATPCAASGLTQRWTHPALRLACTGNWATHCPQYPAFSVYMLVLLGHLQLPAWSVTERMTE